MTRRLKKELWPYSVTVTDAAHTDEIHFWLEDTLGPWREYWNAVYYSDHTDYYFREGKSATMFSLRWL
jgi:hypothetical protein